MSARKLWLVIGLVFASMLLVVGCAFSRGDSKDPVSPDDLPTTLGEASVADIQVTVDEIGTIEPVLKVDVKSTLSGKVTQAAAREGDRVARGQVLAQVEPDVNQAQTLSEVKSQLARAELELDKARMDLDNQKSLFHEGYASEQSLRDAQVAFDRAQEGHKNAKEKYRIVEESGVPLKADLASGQRVNVVSPMNGVVIARNVEVGDTITSGVSSFNAGTVMFTVADVGSMLIKASINEVDIGKIREKMPVEVTVDAFPYRRYSGRVTHISPAAKLREKIKIFEVEIALDDQHGEFRPGMTANVSIKGDRKDKALSVPSEGIFKRDGKDVVFALREKFAPPKTPGAKPKKNRNGKIDLSAEWERFFEARPVKVGLASLERAEIVEGLAEGQKIALDDPTRVAVKEE